LIIRRGVEGKGKEEPRKKRQKRKKGERIDPSTFHVKKKAPISNFNFPEPEGRRKKKGVALIFQESAPFPLVKKGKKRRCIERSLPASDKN